MRNFLIASAALAAALVGTQAFAGDITVGVNGYSQTNNAPQISGTVLNHLTVAGKIDAEAAAVGVNSLYDANGNITISAGNFDQTNNGLQAAVLFGNDLDLNKGSIAAKALGVSAGFVATGSIDGGNNGVEQKNNGTQLAGTVLNNVETSGKLDVSAVAVGASASFEALNGDFSVYGGGFDRQTNNGLQASLVLTNDVDFGGASSSLAQSIGTSLSVKSSTATTQWSQTNNGPQLALNIANDVHGAGAASFSSVTAGNLINVTANSVGQTAYFQTNNAPSLAATYLGASSFDGALSVGSTAIGSSVTVKTN